MRAPIVLGILLIALLTLWVTASGYDTRDLYSRALAARDRGELEAAERLIGEAAEANRDVDDPATRVRNAFEIQNARAEILFAGGRRDEATRALVASWRMVSERRLGTADQLREAAQDVHRIADAQLDDDALVALQRSFSELSLAAAQEHEDEPTYHSAYEHQLYSEIQLIEERFGREDSRLAEPLFLWGDLLYRRGAYRDGEQVLRRARALRDAVPAEGA